MKLIILGCLITAISPATSLTTTFSKTKLPAGISGTSAFYDGRESIYIFGGKKSGSFSDEDTDQILRFSITSEEITQLAKILGKGSFGSAEHNSEGDVFYFGGNDDNFSYNSVYKFNPHTNETTNVTKLPYNVQYGSSVKLNDNSDTVIIFGGYTTDHFLQFDMKTFEYEIIGRLPDRLMRFGSTSVRVGDFAYVFGDGTSNNEREMVTKVNLKTFEVESIATDLPDMKFLYPTSVYDGSKYIYIIGGYSKDKGTETKGILKFNPDTFEHEFVKIDNFPVFNDLYFEYAPAVVYLEKLNRIYFLGGEIKNSSDLSKKNVLDGIFYVDLTQEEVPTTSRPATNNPPTTTKKPNGSSTHEDDKISWLWLMAVLLMNLVSCFLGWTLSYLYHRRSNDRNQRFTEQQIAYLPETSITEKP